MQLVINGNLRTLTSNAFLFDFSITFSFCSEGIEFGLWTILDYYCQFKAERHKQRMKCGDARAINHTFEAFDSEDFVANHFELWTINIHNPYAPTNIDIYRILFSIRNSIFDRFLFK